MHHLKAVAVEDGAILATGEDGVSYRVELDDELRARLRSGVPSGSARRSTPREIQLCIRGGMSADQVAAYTGADIDYVRRFEGPILAERAYMVEAAHAVPVPGARRSADEPMDDATPAFGTVLEERLEKLSASRIRWSSWKEPEGGWIVKVEFTADGIDHDARWSFDPKRGLLTPLGGEAMALSQQAEIGTTLLPRLRAVSSSSDEPDTTRFDSAAFELPEAPAELPDPVVPVERTPTGRLRTQPPRTGTIGVVQQPPTPAPADTSDLLEALRRRRGERPAPEAADEETPRTPATVRVLDRTRTESRPEPRHEPRPEQVETTEVPRGRHPAGTQRNRRGRTSMPSWDEIVFGARPEDDPA